MTPALMSGAWHLPAEKRLVLLFANVAEQAITAQVQYDLPAAGLSGKTYTRSKWTPLSDSAPSSAAPLIDETIAFPPRSVWAWEFRARD